MVRLQALGSDLLKKLRVEDPATVRTVPTVRVRVHGSLGKHSLAPVTRDLLLHESRYLSLPDSCGICTADQTRHMVKKHKWTAQFSSSPKPIFWWHKLRVKFGQERIHQA